MRKDRFLSTVRLKVEENLDNEDFGIPELCQKLAISRTQLHRKLKTETGKSTSYFIRSIRMARAKQLLKTTNLNVSEVGYKVGYGNCSHFTQVFNQEYGYPPSHFKKFLGAKD